MISIRKAKQNAEREMSKPVKTCGFEQRELAPGLTVSIFYYSVHYEELGTMYRADVYENDRKNAGMAFDSV